jgi:hypothetical protein
VNGQLELCSEDLFWEGVQILHKGSPADLPVIEDTPLDQATFLFGRHQNINRIYTFGGLRGVMKNGVTQSHSEPRIFVLDKLFLSPANLFLPNLSM